MQIRLNCLALKKLRSVKMISLKTYNASTQTRNIKYRIPNRKLKLNWKISREMNVGFWGQRAGDEDDWVECLCDDRDHDDDNGGGQGSEGEPRDRASPVVGQLKSVQVKVAASAWLHSIESNCRASEWVSIGYWFDCVCKEAGEPKTQNLWPRKTQKSTEPIDRNESQTGIGGGIGKSATWPRFIEWHKAAEKAVPYHRSLEGPTGSLARSAQASREQSQCHSQGPSCLGVIKNQ